VVFSDESMNSETMQVALKRLNQSVDMMIEDVSRLYEGLDSSI
jgi:hypothetical protein